MGFHNPNYDIVLATIHVPLKNVSQMITTELLDRKLADLVLFRAWEKIFVLQ